MNDLTEKYFVKNKEFDDYVDFTTLFDGLRILKIDGLTSRGQAKNVYTASWEYENEEDFAIVMQDDEDPIEIIRECSDLDITFIIKGSYAENSIDVHTQHLNFENYMTKTDVWIKSAYQNNLEVHCVCLKEYKPTTEKYHRGTDSYVMGTITLHMLEKPERWNIVYYTLDNTTTKYKILARESFTLPLLTESGKQIIPASVKVSMGESNITDNTYNYETNTIVIASVDDMVYITAESAIIPATYKPMLCVRGIYVANAKNTAFTIPYYTNNNTKIIFDVLVVSFSSNTTLFATRTYQARPSIRFQLRKGTNNYSSFTWYNNEIQTNANTRIGTGTRQYVILDKNKITYTDNTGNRTTLTAPYEEFQFDNTHPIDIGGEVYHSDGYTYYSPINSYRTTIMEEDTIMHDLVPCESPSTNRFGLYDVTTGEFYYKARTLWLGNPITITRYNTNCSNTVSSGYRADFTVMGETWVSTFSPTSGYTFNKSSAVFQVLVNGEDKTNELATYNSTTDKWTVTLVAHWNDDIEITATAVAP